MTIMSSKNKRKNRELNIQAQLNELKHLVNEIAELEEKDMDATDPLDKLFNIVEWLTDNKASERIENVLQGMNDDEIKLIRFVINETVYRLECTTTDEKPITIIPFAIPIAILVPVEYESKIKSIQNLPETSITSASTKLIRKGLGLEDEPTIVVDSRLWKTNVPEWRNHAAVRNYLKGIEAYLSKLSPVIPPLVDSKRMEKQKNTHGNSNQACSNTDGTFLITRAFTGAVISNNDDIDETMFGYKNIENIPENIEVPESMFMTEFTIACASELEKIGIKDAKVFPLSQWPAELWEVPEIAFHFNRITEIRIKATQAVNKLRGGAPRNGYLKIEPSQDEKYIKLLAYEEHENKPFFTYTWQIIPELENPDTIIDDIITIAKDTLNIDNIVSSISK